VAEVDWVGIVGGAGWPLWNVQADNVISATSTKSNQNRLNGRLFRLYFINCVPM
jgi:hypothetical protein